MTTRAHYEVRPEGEPTGEWLTKTGSNTEAEFDRAGEDARRASLAKPGRTVEVRYRGYSEPAGDLLVAAWRDGEQLDVRQLQAERGGRPLEQRCVEPGHWLIEGRHVRAVYQGRSRNVLGWQVAPLDGDTDPPAAGFLYLADVREWIRDQDDAAPRPVI